MPNMKPADIHPIFDRILGRSEKENLLKQNARVIWFTGLSGSGKSTLAIALEQELYKKGYLTQVLDGDNIRSGINSNLGFSENDREENIRRIAEVSKLFLNCGIITLNCFISPTESMRNMAKRIIGAENFIEVYVKAPLEVCESRDPKGLYVKARKGEIKDFTGIHAPFEEPLSPHVTINTSNTDIEQATGQLLNFVEPILMKK